MPESNVGDRSSYPEVAALIRDLSLKVRNALRPTFEGRGRELIPPQAKVAATALQRINPCKASVVVNAAGLRTCSNLDRPTPLTHADGELWDAMHAAFMVCVRLASGERPTTADAETLERCADALHVVPAERRALEPLFGALVDVVAASGAVARFYPVLLDRKESHGLPKAEDWPNSPARELREAQHAERVKAENERLAEADDCCSIDGALPPGWTEFMVEWSGYYQAWWDSIERARKLVNSPGVAPIMDAGEARTMSRWTVQTVKDLDKLAETLHPVNVPGADGLGIFWAEIPPLPEVFRTSAEAVRERVKDLRAAMESPPEPSQSESALPDLLERAAELGAMKAMSVASASVGPDEGTWVRSDTAVRHSGLDAGTIRKRAKREHWPMRRAGSRLWSYPLARLRAAWPGKEFDPNASGN